MIGIVTVGTEDQTPKVNPTTDLPRVAVDVGGTFTDVVLLTADDLLTTKVPSTTPQHEGVLSGIIAACEQAAIPPDSIDLFVHATTVSVNALLEGTGAKTALLTTEGFRDILEIGRQNRPSLYDFSAEKTPPLVPRKARYELSERATPSGIVKSISDDDVESLISTLSDFDSVAVSFLHSYAQPENEQRAAEILRERLSIPVSVSHEVLPEFREYERTSTTVVDATLRPVIESYLDKLVAGAKQLGLPEPVVMQSNGGVAGPERIRNRPVTTVLSGPAAGVVGARATATAADNDVPDVVTFDMGGTSSDVGLVREGTISRRSDATIAGYPVGVPMVDIETVGSGGGSIGWVDDGGALRVGPQSAGSDPGPACYGNGSSHPTVTDASVVLGYIGKNTAFGGELSLDIEAARDTMAQLAGDAGLDSPLAAAAGVYRVANATMMRAIRSVTVERGHDPRSFGLIAFGGAGPLHALALADSLEMDRVLLPLAGGVLSAYGLLAANEKHDATRTHRVRLSNAERDQLESRYTELTREVTAAASKAASEVNIDRTASLRYVGQSFELAVSVDEPVDVDRITSRFSEAHQQAYGYTMDGEVELVTIGVSGTVPNDPPSMSYSPDTTVKRGKRTIYYDGEEHKTPVYERTAVKPETTIQGPAILEGTESTTLLPPNWYGTVRSNGTICCLRGEN